VGLNSSAIAEIFVQRLCAFKSACPNQDLVSALSGVTGQAALLRLDVALILLYIPT
jgi:hypothetical protein